MFIDCLLINIFSRYKYELFEYRLRQLFLAPFRRALVIWCWSVSAWTECIYLSNAIKSCCAKTRWLPPGVDTSWRKWQDSWIIKITSFLPEPILYTSYYKLMKTNDCQGTSFGLKRCNSKPVLLHFLVPSHLLFWSGLPLLQREWLNRRKGLLMDRLKQQNN